MPVAAQVRAAVRESVSGLPREFWWLWTSTLVNRLGSFVTTFMALYLTVSRGYSASYAGLVASLIGLGGVISSLAGGVLADRLGRRPTMLIAQSSTAVSVALLAFMRDPVAIAAVGFLVGIASNASRPAVQAMIADIVPPEDRVRAFSINFWAINLGFAVSSVLAGLIARYSYLAGFLGEALMTLLCAVLVFLKVTESRPERAEATAEKPAAPEIRLGEVLRNGRFMGVAGLSFALALLFQQAYVGLPVAMGADGFSSTDFGLAIAVNGVLIVTLQIPVTRFIQQRDPRRLLIVSALLAGYGFGLTAFAGSLGFYVLAIGVWSLAEIINAPTQTGLVVRLSPVHGRGRYQGVYSMSWAMAALAAPLLSGFVIDRFGAQWLWAGCAVVGTAAAAGYWLLMRHLGTAKAAEPMAEPAAGAVTAAAVAVPPEGTPTTAAAHAASVEQVGSAGGTGGHTPAGAAVGRGGAETLLGRGDGE